ncbi:MAG: acetolactate synthase small subunit [Candidatus Omnitrophica bacterium]|nr:acetolactate synthase small subunit [Candidatus Omnitrophota bacterium]MCM8831719.1 acetolactate synthase small subunit [Candidatus Omnitrophota bacterium]
MRHTISLLVENKPGVLVRIAGLFSARGYNISSLAVSETHDPTISYMTMVVDAENERVLEQIKKQLNKLIDVITVTDFTKKEHFERELILVKINCPEEEKSKLEKILDKYTAKLIKHKSDIAIVEFVGEQTQIKNMLDELKEFKIIELVRSGRIAMALS